MPPPSLTTRRWSKTPVDPAIGPSTSDSAPTSTSSAPPRKTTRQPSLRQLARNDLSSSNSARRPQTTPTSSSLAADNDLLRKPNLHWHLNAAAARSLSREQTARLYALFRFYDSSARGDALPSIDCGRLVNIMRDAGMLALGSCGEADTTIAAPDKANGDPSELRAKTIESMFAQAVLGSLRAYLDADERPALPFPSFCGVLLHLSAVKFPTLAAVSPEKALQALIAKLDTILEPSAASAGVLCSASPFDSTARPPSALVPIGSLRSGAAGGLLDHFPSDGMLANWETSEAVSSNYTARNRNGEAVDTACADFRSRGAFPDVIAGFTSDVREQAQHEERTTRAYLVPQELAAQFPNETLAMIVAKFRTFDVLDRGALPRVEMFALLSSLAKPLELTNVHGALAQLSMGGANSGRDVTLLQLLETLNNIRASRRASSNRKAPPFTAAAGTSATATENIPVDPASPSGADEVAPQRRDNVDGDGHRGRHHKTKHGHHHAPSQQRLTSTSNTRHRKPPGGVAAPSGKHRKSVASHVSNMGESESQHEAQHPTSGSHTKKRAHNQHMHRVSSKGAISNNSVSEFLDNELEEEELRNDSSQPRAKLLALRLANQGELSTADDASSNYTASSTGGGGGGAANSGRSSASKQSDEPLLPLNGRDTAASGLTQHLEVHGDVHALEILTHEHLNRAPGNGRMARRVLEVVLLLGGDHDGAIVSVFSLSLTTRELTEHSGVLIRGDRVNDQVTTTVQPTQHNLASALRMLKRWLGIRIGEGFLPRYPSQIAAMDNMLDALQRKEPRYNSSIGSASPSHSAHDVDVKRELSSRDSPKRASSPTRSILNSPSRVVARTLSPEQLRTANELWAAAKDVTGDSWVRTLNAVTTDRFVVVRNDLVK